MFFPKEGEKEELRRELVSAHFSEEDALSIVGILQGESVTLHDLEDGILTESDLISFGIEKTVFRRRLLVCVGVLVFGGVLKMLLCRIVVETV